MQLTIAASVATLKRTVFLLICTFVLFVLFVLNSSHKWYERKSIVFECSRLELHSSQDKY